MHKMAIIFAYCKILTRYFIKKFSLNNFYFDSRLF